MRTWALATLEATGQILSGYKAPGFGTHTSFPDLHQLSIWKLLCLLPSWGKSCLWNCPSDRNHWSFLNADFHTFLCWPAEYGVLCEFFRGCSHWGCLVVPLLSISSLSTFTQWSSNHCGVQFLSWGSVFIVGFSFHHGVQFSSWGSIFKPLPNGKEP